MNKEPVTTEYIEEQIILLQKQRDQLVKNEEIKNKKAFDLSEQLKKLKSVRDKTEKAIIDTQKKLNKHCTHEKVRTETYDVEGGYLDRAEHWTYYYCEICGVKFDEKVTYGGFA